MILWCHLDDIGSGIWDVYPNPNPQHTDNNQHPRLLVAWYGRYVSPRRVTCIKVCSGSRLVLCRGCMWLVYRWKSSQQLQRLKCRHTLQRDATDQSWTIPGKGKYNWLHDIVVRCSFVDCRLAITPSPQLNEESAHQYMYLLSMKHLRSSPCTVQPFAVRNM